MLDINFIRENREKVKKAAKDKNRIVDIDKLLEFDEERRKLTFEVDNLRKKRNDLAKLFLTDKDKAKDEGVKVKEEIKKREEKLTEINNYFEILMFQVPNVPDESVPVGPDAGSNKEIKKWGHIPELSFKIKDHIEIARDLDLADLERGVKVGGFRAYFLKNEGALLEMAVLSYTFKKLALKGYTPLVAPSLVKEFTLIGSGQIPWSKEEIYYLQKQDVYLSGTAEVPVTAYFSGEVLDEKDLPKKFVAFSPCFRSEAGSYGKDTKGLYRLHQFNKIEQVIINTNNYKSSIICHEELLANAEGILQDLKLPYRVMLMCTGDMGEPQVKKYDIETWMPSRNAYGETMSNSFMGDFQTRRLNIRYKGKDGKVSFTHSLNNTAIASPRILIAIIENYQQKDGSVVVPEVLRPYVGKDVIGKK